MDRDGRLRRLLDLSRWTRTKVGNYRIRYRPTRGKPMQWVVYASRGGWRINVEDVLGREVHPDRAAAIGAAFRSLEPPIVGPPGGIDRWVGPGAGADPP